MINRRAIFITGAGSGIGRATARYFTERGWFAGLADVNQRGIDETSALLPADSWSSHVMDVRDFDAWTGALEHFAEKSGRRMDVLFNNAGIGTGGDFADMSPEETDRLIAINLGGVVKGIHASLALLRQTRGSAILNTGSASGFYGVSGLAVYSATKFAVRGLTEALDIEFVRDDIKVRSLMPAFIDTPLLDQISPGSNEPGRVKIAAGGFEISPVEKVAEAAWNAVHGKKIHTLVGKTARQLAWMARLTPGLIVRRAKALALLSDT